MPCAWVHLEKLSHRGTAARPLQSATTAMLQQATGRLCSITSGAIQVLGTRQIRETSWALALMAAAWLEGHYLQTV